MDAGASYLATKRDKQVRKLVKWQLKWHIRIA